jgi:hypothetical protein
MKRVITALAGGAVVATVAFASASALQLNGGYLKASDSKSTVCDSDGVDVHWGLETDNNTVSNVRISGIDAACAGAKMFVKVDGKKYSTTVAAPETKITFPAVDASTLNSVRVWIQS